MDLGAVLCAGRETVAYESSFAVDAEEAGEEVSPPPYGHFGCVSSRPSSGRWDFLG